MNARSEMRAHLTLFVVWCFVTVPGLLYWKQSISFLVFVSLYAILVGHLGGFAAARGNLDSPSMRDFRRLERKVDELRRAA